MATLAKAVTCRPLFAWVLDDHQDQLERLADSLKTLGFESATEGDIETINELVEGVWSGEPPPHIIVIDQHWKTELSNLEVLGRKDIKIRSQGRAGEAIGRYLRSVDELKDSTLVMTSVRHDDLGVGSYDLEPVITLPKEEIYKLERDVATGSSPDDTLYKLGVDRPTDAYLAGSIKFLAATADKLGVEPSSTVFLAGARSRSRDADERLETLLLQSRDARTRITLLLQIMTALREAYGPNLPDAQVLSKDLGMDLLEILIQGTLDDVLFLKYTIDDRAGGQIG